MRTLSLVLFGFVMTMVSALLTLQCLSLAFGGVFTEMNTSAWHLFEGQANSPSRIIPASPPNTLSSSSMSQGESPSKTMEKGGYFQYQTGILGNGEDLILFFTDPACTLCADIDAQIKSLYRSSGAPYSTYRVPMTSFPSLVSRFSATSGSLLLMGPSGEFISALQLSASGSIVPAFQNAFHE